MTDKTTAGLTLELRKRKLFAIKGEKFDGHFHLFITFTFHPLHWKSNIIFLGKPSALLQKLKLEFQTNNNLGSK